MATFTTVLRAEITKIARKEARDIVRPLRNQNKEMKQTLVRLKKRVAQMEKAKLTATPPPKQDVPTVPDIPEKELERARPTSGMVAALRERLGLSQRELAKLVGVTSQSVYLWEAKDDRLSLRREPKARLLELRRIGKREARRRLEAMQQ